MLGLINEPVPGMAAVIDDVFASVMVPLDLGACSVRRLTLSIELTARFASRLIGVAVLDPFSPAVPRLADGRSSHEANFANHAMVVE